MFNIVLHRPQIAPNTGNIIRLCANTGANLHLIEPIGFNLTDKKLRRAGLDYHDLSLVKTHDSLKSCLQSLKKNQVFAFSTKGKTNVFHAHFIRNSLLVFGSETAGLPPGFLNSLAPEQSLKIPMVESSRCLNLSNAVAVGLFEAWRQNGLEGSFKN
ncbi:MAG: tRNA (cytidine(34)-2'-O)-methyltransferase [Pseudomonadota bacterium]|nr:tRNA (cytidine(34)-2'-O)-methyltransferase [Pseudomonadota bacterium]